MPKMTDEKKRRIIEQYRKTPIYKKTAEVLGIDERTVRRIVLEHEKAMMASSTSSSLPTAGEASGGNAAVKSSRMIGKSHLDEGSSKQQQSPSTTPSASVEQEEERRKILQTVYTDFEAGKKPHQLVAQYGYDPYFIKDQYMQYNMMKGLDVESTLRTILEVFGAKERTELKEFYDSFNKKST
jgi:hypothetical protein